MYIAYVLTILWITILFERDKTKECIYGFLLKSNDLLEK